MTKEEIRVLARRLRNASNKYYNSDPLMEDAQFDAMKKMLQEEDPDHPFLGEIGAPLADHLTKVQHNIPMGSLDNAANEEEYNNWHGKHDQETVTMFKLDGSSIEIVYEDGLLVQAITRGNGVEGEDVTQNVRKFKNVLEKLDMSWSGSVRGEAMLTKEDFTNHFSIESNPRNSANGTVRRSDGDRAEHLVFVAFDIGENGFTKHSEKLEFLNKLGFEVVSHFVTKSSDNVLELYKKFCGDSRGNLPFEIDGLVVRVNDTTHFKGMGERDSRPKGAIAFKFPAMGAVTKLLGVKISIGSQGQIVPTANLAPVEVGGVTVSSALLNNWQEIERIGVAIGDQVTIERRGDVIPKVTGVAIEAPDRALCPEPVTCPFCKSDLETDMVSGVRSAHVYCRNSGCEAQNERRLKSWINKRDIKQIGDSLREELYYIHGIKQPWQLYTLTQDQLGKMSRGGGVVGALSITIMKELEKSKTATLAEFMGSLSIKLLGRRQAVHMIEQGIDTLEKFRTVGLGQLVNLEGFSNIKATTIYEGIAKASNEIDKLLEMGINIVEPSQEPEEEVNSDGKLSSKTFCFTGKILKEDNDGNRYTKAVIGELVKENGGVIADKVNGDLNFLVQADPSSQSSKTKKASKLGVEIISHDKLFEMING